MTARPLLAALVLVVALGGCSDQGITPNTLDDCPAGTQRGGDDMTSCVPLGEPPATTDGGAAGRAAQAREDQFDDCRAAGKSEPDCLAEGGAP